MTLHWQGGPNIDSLRKPATRQRCAFLALEECVVICRQLQHRQFQHSELPDRQLHQPQRHCHPLPHSSCPCTQRGSRQRTHPLRADRIGLQRLPPAHHQHNLPRKPHRWLEGIECCRLISLAAICEAGLWRVRLISLYVLDFTLRTSPCSGCQ